MNALLGSVRAFACVNPLLISALAHPEPLAIWRRRPSRMRRDSLRAPSSEPASMRWATAPTIGQSTLERLSGAKGRFPPKFEAEMPSSFASSSSAISAAEACGATLEAVLRSRNLKELFGSIQQGRYCDATAHRP